MQITLREPSLARMADIFSSSVCGALAHHLVSAGNTALLQPLPFQVASAS